ncbi:alkylhydroperoxidase [Cupriavidus sp. USMAA2-4]|uniref:Alkylhydroperoxidase n=1 Tax=Cupriavidus malaysiensis TaxID=367825 RepID=A0ABN4TSF8_9BURK|nr:MULTISPECIES: carboxymuconolactone decarboxylase family protein [Cupriavidus]AOY96380.1 alkylhydroperoxidase [Cupriavidus sp. USMAA2-4]AOZ03222.1 alkylhydroperoxidase [Cupriavidus sp. USMAHM13]AOZ09414.1 alkylhydroperoxidase [Cupriavidus malaysiensis]
MSRLPLLSADNAPTASRPFVERAIANNGFLPNLIAALAHSPAALEAYLTVGEINGRSGLTLAEREVVQITAAAVHGCAFCVAGHTAVALKKARLETDQVEALRTQAPLREARHEALAAFTRAIIATRGAVPDAALQDFLHAGFEAGQALDVVLGVSLATLCNFANNLAQSPLNAELEPYRWAPATA